MGHVINERIFHIFCNDWMDCRDAFYAVLCCVRTGHHWVRSILAYGLSTKPFIKLLWNFKNFLFSFLLTDYLTYLTDYLMPSDKRNSITTRAMGSISSLFNIASSRDVPFRQPLVLQLQYSHHGSTKAYLCSPLFLIPFSTTT